MTIFQAIFLGLVQGLTEFLPVSSSGHLVLAPYLLGWEIPSDQVFVFDVLVQMGTLVAVILFFWSDLKDIAIAFLQALAHRKPFESPEAKMGWYLILATLPAGLAGLLIKDLIERTFSSIPATSLFLLGTGALLVLAERVGQRSRELADLGWKDALWIGCFQVLAVFPGISRSGSTIAGGLVRDLKRPTAARFSFLMSIPVMLAAGLLSLLDLRQVPHLEAFLGPLLAGFLTAAIVGYLSIKWLLHYLTRHPLTAFAAYVTVVGLATLITVLV